MGMYLTYSYSYSYDYFDLFHWYYEEERFLTEYYANLTTVDDDDDDDENQEGCEHEMYQHVKSLGPDHARQHHLDSQNYQRRQHMKRMKKFAAFVRPEFKPKHKSKATRTEIRRGIKEIDAY